MNDHRPGHARDQMLARLAQRGRALPRWLVVTGLSWLVFMTVWGFVRSLT